MAKDLPKEVEFLLDKLKEKDKAPATKKATGGGRFRPALGQLLLYVYDAKHKNDLPYWDALPLMVLMGIDKKYMVGINIHYIPYTYRLQFIKALMKRKAGRNRVRYKDIKDAWQEAKIPGAYAYLAIRKYLLNRVKSNIKQFDEDNYLPVVRNVLPDFKKASNDAVMNDIIRKVKEQRRKGK